MSDERNSLSLETEPDPNPTILDDGEPEPEGVVEVTPGEKVVSVSVLAAERKRSRDAAEKRVREQEVEPLRRKAQLADQLAENFNAVRPDLEWLQQHPEARAPKAPEPPAVSDAEAETYARRHQLFTADGGKLDTVTAKSILAEHRAEVAQIAEQTARRVTEQYVAPVQAQSAATASKDNFLRIAASRDADGGFIFQDQRAGAILLEEWRKLPSELSADPGAAEVVRLTAIGRIYSELGRRQSGGREPLYTESAGGRSFGESFGLTPLERKIAAEARVSTKEFEAGAKKYIPGGPNSLE